MTRINYTIEMFHAFRAAERAEELKFIKQSFLEDCKKCVRRGRHQRGKFIPTWFELAGPDAPAQGAIVTSLSRWERQRKGWQSIADLVVDYYDKYGVSLADLAIKRFEIAQVRARCDDGVNPATICHILADGSVIEETPHPQRRLEIQHETIRLPREADVLEMFDRCESICDMENLTGLRAEFEQVNEDLSIWEIYIPIGSYAIRITQEDRRSDPDAWYLCVYKVQRDGNEWVNRWDKCLRDERYPYEYEVY